MSDETKTYADKLFAEARLYARDEAAKAKESRDYADKLFADAKLFAKEEADKARKAAVGILGAVALVLGIASTLGLRAHFDSRIDTAANNAATNAAQKASDDIAALLRAIRTSHQQSLILASETSSFRDQAKQILADLKGVAATRTTGLPDKYLILGDQLVCYGSQELIGDAAHRDFAFTFPRAFARPPIVTTALNAAPNPGFAFAIYGSTITTNEYTGAIVEVKGRPNIIKVTMHYMAIGDNAKPKETQP
jgi:hypothetical protein